MGDAADRDDVLTLLLSARHEDGSPMTPQEMRDELVTDQTLGAVKRYLAGLFLLKLSSIDYSADSLAA